MSSDYSESELEAYLEEGLDPEEMAGIEAELRGDQELAKRLAAIIARRDAGMHSLGAIWRRHRISCPTREQLGSYLLKALDGEDADYVAFHVDLVGCRFCRANIEDLKARQSEALETATSRRNKYFQSSAGYLNRK